MACGYGVAAMRIIASQLATNMPQQFEMIGLQAAETLG
jgi:hypothetical protein